MQKMERGASNEQKHVKRERVVLSKCLRDGNGAEVIEIFLSDERLICRSSSAHILCSVHPIGITRSC